MGINKKLIDILQDRINFHESSIKIFESYGNMLNNDIKISEGQIMESREIMKIIYELEDN